MMKVSTGGSIVGMARWAGRVGVVAMLANCSSDGPAASAAQACRDYVAETQPNSQLTELPLDELVATATRESSDVWLLTGHVIFDKGFASEQRTSISCRVEQSGSGDSRVLVVQYGI